MTWKEFKEQVEAQGVTDVQTVKEIVWDGEQAPEVRFEGDKWAFYIE